MREQIHDSTVSRRNVLKGIGAGAAAGASGLASTGTSAGTAAAVDAGEPVALQYFHEDWNTITNDLDRVANLGVDALWIQAPQQSRLDYDHPLREGRNDPPLNYQPIDHRSFDSVLGTEAELQTLIDTAHGNGVGVYVDTVMNHMAAGQDPKYEFPQFSYEHFHHDSDPDHQTKEIYGMPDLEQASSHVRSEMYDYMGKIADMGADGYRFDAAKNIPKWFWRDYANPWAEYDFGGMFRVGEVFTGDTGLLQEYADTGMYCFDYSLYFTIEEVFDHGDMSRLQGAGLVAQDPGRSMPFVDNHDVQSPTQYHLAHAFALTIGGYPMLYNLYPDEILENDAIANMVWVKRNLAGGATDWLQTDSDLAVYTRGENLLVGLNNSSGAREQWVQTPWTNTELHDFAGNAPNLTTTEYGWAYLTVPAEGWTFYAPTDEGGTGGQTYVIRNVNSGKALDVEGSASYDGGNVHQWEYYGNDNQQWLVESLDNGYYRLKASHSGKALEVESGADENGANVQQWDYYGINNQQWAIEDVDGEGYRISARHSDKVLDVAGWSTENGGNVHQWEWHGDANQRWTFEQV